MEVFPGKRSSPLFPGKTPMQGRQGCVPSWDLKFFEKEEHFEAILVLPVSESLTTLVLTLHSFIKVANTHLFSSIDFPLSPSSLLRVAAQLQVSLLVRKLVHEVRADLSHLLQDSGLINSVVCLLRKF